jgi:fucose 4-O-acetylase-like acetyltransferase
MPNYRKKKDILFGIGGILLIGIYLLIGDSFIVYADDVFSTEHDLARTFSGTAYILGIQAVIISFFIWIEGKNIKLKVPLLTWVGINSLLVFALHRILFVRIIAPISIMVGSQTGRTLGAGTIEVFTYVLIAIGMCYFIKKSPISDIILQKNK